MSLPIAGASAGDSFSPGNGLSVVNSALGFFPVGIAPPAVGGARLVSDASIFIPDFDHVDAALDTPSLNVPFSFGTPGNLNFFIPPSVDPPLEHLFGLPVIDQELGIQPLGIAPPATALGIATRLVFGAELGGFADFLFVDPYAAPPTLNVPFYFGPGLVIAGVSLGDTFAKPWNPIELVEGPFTLIDITVGDTFSAGQYHRVADQPPVNFLFTGAYDPQVGSSIDLPFGGLLTQWVLYAGILPEHTDDNLTNGLIAVENSAIGLIAEGFDSSDLQRGNTRFYFSLDGEAGLLGFSFVQSYNPGSGVGQFPPALNVPFYFAGPQQVGPGAINSLEFGPIEIARDYQLVDPTPGIDSVSFGQTAVKPEGRFLNGSGHDSLALGFDHEIFNLDRTFNFSGMELDSLQFGSEVSPDLELFVSHYARYVDLGLYGIQDLLFGTQWVSNYERYLEPDGWTSWSLPYLQLGQPDVGFKIKYLYPNSALFEGVVSEYLTVDRGEQYLLGIGGIYDFGAGLSSEFYNLTGILGPGVTLGEQALGGSPLVYNSDQYIEEPFWPIDWLKFGQGFVYNRNRSISPYAVILADYFLYGTPYIFNNARLVAPEGVLLDPNIEPRWNSDLFIAHYIRELDILGFESFRPTGFPFGTTVHNSSFQFLIESFDSLELPDTHRLFDPAQFLVGVGKIDESIFGTTWFSFSPRYIDLTGSLFSSYGIFDEAFGDDTGDFRVSNYTYYVYADSVGDSLTQGYHGVKEVFKIFGADPVLPSSDPSTGLQIHNDTLQFFQIGLYSLEMPALTWVSRSPRNIVLDFRHSISLVPHLFGDTLISNRDRTFYEFGNIHSLKIDPFTLVYMQIPAGPYTFYLRLDDAGGFGIGPLLNRWGLAELRKHPYDVGDIDSLVMGSPSTVGGIFPLWDWASSRFSFGVPIFGEPLNLISNVSVGDSQVVYGDPAVSPHTIWARYDTPQQAYDNHFGASWHAIDSDDPARTQTPKEDAQWGTANVFLPGITRTLLIYHNGYSSATGIENSYVDYWGAAYLDLFDRKIEVDSLLSSLFGYPEFPYNKSIYVPSLPDTELGDVEFFQEYVPYTQTITVGGLDSSVFGDTDIELFNRDLLIAGWDATLFGDNNPMVYRYPRGFTDAGGTDMTIWGTTWVSHYTRSFELEGFYSFTTDYDPMLFARRIKVLHKTSPFFLDPINDLSFGDVGIRNQSLRITAYQIPPPRCIGEDVYVQH